jgi:hypothetical protein
MAGTDEQPEHCQRVGVLDERVSVLNLRHSLSTALVALRATGQAGAPAVALIPPVATTTALFFAGSSVHASAA